MKLYKCLRAGQLPTHGSGKWNPGKWRTEKGPILPCNPGTLHLCRPQDILEWGSEELWEAEYEGELLETKDKVCVLKARAVRKVETWNGSNLRHFACDCAERVLHLANDDRCDGAVMLARARAFGFDVPAIELFAAGDAAGDAAAWVAWGAAWAAGDAAAWAAREAAWAAGGARAAAGGARAAAGAAWAAARGARAAARGAREAEREWQVARLMHYLEGGKP